MLIKNKQFQTFIQKLEAEGITAKRMWSVKRPGARRGSIHFFTFTGDGFTPAILAGFVVDLGSDGYVFYPESRANKIDEDVAAIRGRSKPSCFGLMIDDDDSADLFLFNSDAEREAHMWSYAIEHAGWDGPDANADTDAMAQFKAYFDDDISEAMTACRCGWKIEDGGVAV